MGKFNKNTFSPGFVESTNSSKSITKEDLAINQVVPEDILNNSEMLNTLTSAYYDFMNLKSYNYTSVETFEGTILSDTIRFRISDPNNENDEFYVWDSGLTHTARLDI